MGDSSKAFTGARINVVGTTGSGKTTAARAIAERLGCRHIELDALFWKPNWGETPDDEFLSLVDEATQGERWVLDGNYSRTRSIVWPRVDTVIWLDYSFLRVFLQLLRRTTRRAVRRVELWDGCQERLRKSFFSSDSILLWFLKTYWRRRRNYRTLFTGPEYAHIQLLHFRTPKALRQWLNSLLV
ncbi:MAG: adenylate kinase [Candidatus Atribacteria bacterium]|nr:MAG: adenylate kinase [Candidatus Atribacteria bacterium]